MTEFLRNFTGTEPLIFARKVAHDRYRDFIVDYVFNNRATEVSQFTFNSEAPKIVSVINYLAYLEFKYVYADWVYNGTRGVTANKATNDLKIKDLSPQQVYRLPEHRVLKEKIRRKITTFEKKEVLRWENFLLYASLLGIPLEQINEVSSELNATVYNSINSQ